MARTFRSITRSGISASAFALGLVSMAFGAQAPEVISAGAHATPRILAPVGAASVALPGNTHPFARPRFDHGAVPENTATGSMVMVLRRSPEQQAALDQLVSSQQDASSANYHHWLTPEQFGKQFGVADADLQSITSYLSAQGFTVGRVFQNRMAIEFSGTAGLVRSAFGTEIHTYVAHGQQFHANASDPKIPAALTPVVAGIGALNDYKTSHALHAQKIQFDPATHRARPMYEDTVSSLEIVTPGDLAKIYDIPSQYDGTGVKVGVIGDSNLNLSFVANYRTSFGLPANQPVVVIDGNDPGINVDAELAYAQMELIAATAPRAQVYYYAATTTAGQPGIDLAAIRAVEDNQVQVLSFGFDNCEQAIGSARNTLYGALWQQAAAQGISVLVDAGNQGSADCDSLPSGIPVTTATQGLAVNGYASSPWVTAVGSTDFYYGPAGTVTGNFTQSPIVQQYWLNNSGASYTSAKGYVPEQPYNESYAVTDQLVTTPVVSATGGGLSQFGDTRQNSAGAPYPVPYWQVAAARNIVGSARVIPDVSLFGGALGNGSAYALCIEATDCVNSTPGALAYTAGGGTVSATGAFSGLAALIVQAKGVNGRLGNLDPTLYSVASATPAAFHDLTVGTNTVACAAGSPNCTNGFIYNNTGHMAYSAVAGYDPASGLGSVDASALIANWRPANTAAAAITLTLTQPGTTTPVLSIHHGDPVQVNVSVTGGSQTATGDVAVVTNSPLPNNAALERLTLSNGSAVDSGLTSLPGGTYQVTARYAGDSTYAAAVSPPVTITVYQSPAQLTVLPGGTPSGSTVPYGTAVTASVLVSAVNANDFGIPTGSVAVQDSGKTVTQLPLNANGEATFTTTVLAPGFHSLNFFYSGDPSFGTTSSTSSLQITVGQAATTTTLTSTLTSLPSSNSVFDLVATVSSQAANQGVAPAGQINFYLGTKLLGSGGLRPGLNGGNAVSVADLRLHGSQIGVGSQSIVATYVPSGSNYAASSSVPLTIVNGGAAGLAFTQVALAPTTPGATQFFDVSTVAFNTSVTGGSTTPTGNVQFYANGTNIGNGNLTNGAVTFFVPFGTNNLLVLPLGANVITAQYTGDATHSPSTNVYRLTIFDDATAPDFSFQSNSVTQPLSSTNPQANFTLQFTALNNFNGATSPITLSYTVPTGLQCRGTPTKPSFSSTRYATVSVSCTLASGYIFPLARQTATNAHSSWWTVTGGTALACIFLFGIPARRRNWQSMLGAVLVIVFSLSIAGCADANKTADQAGGKPASSAVLQKAARPAASTLAAGTYTVLVTASAQILNQAQPNTTTTLVHTLPLQVSVQ